jgi:2-dehydropantoate 2-reductase
MMRHAVLGLGGVGGVLGGALRRAGCEVVAIVRPGALGAHDGRIAVESAVLGAFEVDLPATAILDRDVDVLWVTTKAPDLAGALLSAPPGRVGDALVIPLLNGVDHVSMLRERYRRVAAAAIRVEAERVSPSRFAQKSPFLRIDLAGNPVVGDELTRAGIDCIVRDDEASLLWEKLVVLAPVALVTTALAAPLGAAREDPRFACCRAEALSVAAAEGAAIDRNTVRSFHEAAPAATQSSMQKDVASGRVPEVDAIAGPILRGGARHGIATQATEELAGEVHARAAGCPAAAEGSDAVPGEQDRVPGHGL